MTSYIYALFLVCLSNVCFAQNHGVGKRLITGTVLSFPDSLPLPGATLSAKKLNKVITTDQLGKFNISIPSSPVTLKVSSMGYRTREVIIGPGTTSELAIFLVATSETLKTVIVSTGYQELPAERATGSFSKIDGNLLNRRVSTDIMSRLEGVASSVLFDRRLGTKPAVSVRGRSTIYANDEPLIVLDNFPYEGDLSNINPNDIENITTLKDAAAASIWGVRAGNGVIVITTKRGAYDSPLKIDFNSNVTMGMKPNLFAKPNISSPEFIEIEKFLFSKGYYDTRINSIAHPSISPVVELLIKEREGILSSEETSNGINSLIDNDIRKDFEKFFYERSINQQYALAVRGGSESIAYRFSGGYDRNYDNLGAIYKRINLSSEHSFKPVKNLEVDAGITYTKSQSTAGRPNYTSILSGKYPYPYDLLVAEDGTAQVMDQSYRRSFMDQAEAAGLLSWKYYPLKEVKLTDNITDAHNLLVRAGLTYQFLKGFSGEMKYQYGDSRSQNRNLHSSVSYFTRNLINKYTQVDSNGVIIRPIPLGGILDQNISELSSHSLRGQLNYSQTWGRHYLTAIAGVEIRQIHTNGNAFRTYGYNDAILTTVPVDYETSFSQYYFPLLDERIPEITQFSDILNRFTSAYTNLAWDFDKRYILSFSARKDASNLFGVNSNQRGVPLWSAGMAWNIHNEAFYKAELLPLLKFRFTYGYNGNVDNTLAAFTTMRYSTPSRNLNNQPYGIILNPPNPSLRWEKSRMINIGLDFSVKNNFLSGSIEYYHKRGKDLIGEAPIDPTTGIRNGSWEPVFKGNVASMTGQGIDLDLNSQIINGRFNWRANLLLSYNSNKISHYLVDPGNGSSYLNSGYGIIPIEGKPLYAMFGYRWGGLDPETGNPLGYIADEKSIDYSAIASQTELEKLTYFGPALPTAFGGMRNTFIFKGFSLSFLITYKFGHYFRRDALSYSSLASTNHGHEEISLRWKEPGDELHTNVPSLAYPLNSRRDAFYENAEINVLKADNIRFQDITLSYHITDDNHSRFPFGDTKVYLYAANMGVLWQANERGIDPDFRSGPPLPFSMSLGIKTTFK